MIYSGRKNCTAKDTAYPLRAAKTMCSWLTVIADRDNTGVVYVGGIDEDSGVAAVLGDNSDHTYIGHPLSPQDELHAGADFCNFRETGGPAYIDLNLVYVLSDEDGDGVTFNYGRR